MRIFSVKSSDDAIKIASYLIKGRITYNCNYLFPDKIIFRIARHQADNPEEIKMLEDFIVREEIFPEVESSY